jgi:hypothetical protein
MLTRLGARRVLLRSLAVALLVSAGGALLTLKAADHRDSAALAADPAADIADVYAFVSPQNRVVLAMTVAGFGSPAELGTRSFDPNVLYQFKIDNDGDAVEDLVIQAYATGTGSSQVMHFKGPVAPDRVGKENVLVSAPDIATVPVSTMQTPNIGRGNDVVVFAGERDDPFFFDLVQFQRVVSGQASSFRDPGIDTFGETNVLALVIELPRRLLGPSANIGVWATTSRQL